MAGHFPLSKFDEPFIFETIEKIKEKMIGFGKHNLISANRFTLPEINITIPKKRVKVKVLPIEYIENPLTELAFLVGKFDLVSITDEHPSITKKIYLEVHLNKVTKEIVNIFWVA